MKKDIKNVDIVVRKLLPALIRAINHKLEVIRKKRQKMEVVVVKCQKVKGRISLSNEEKENYKSNTWDEINHDQANDK